MSTFGPAFSPKLDGRRIMTQMEAIRDLMSDGFERTLTGIETATGYPQASISAQLRHLRKGRFGGYEVTKRRAGNGLWVYRLLPPKGQISLLSGGKR